MKAAILLGAGSSVAAGFPSTQCLTNLIVSGKGFERHADGTYRPAHYAPSTMRTARFANGMARQLHAEAKCYFADRNGAPANYEDLFYLAKQAWDEQAGETENPAITAFVDQLKIDTTPMINEPGPQNGDRITFGELLQETCNYIADIVWCSLVRKPTCTNHLEIISEACKSGHVVGIATLCHDAHVEEFLAARGIQLADGFSQEEAGVRYWNDEFMSGRIPFLKLHGSVNWFRLGPDGPENSPDELSTLMNEFSTLRSETKAASGPPQDESFFEERIGFPLNGDHHHTRAANGDWQTALDSRPVLLVGTFNKISEYTSGMFRDLHHKFRSMLREVDKLVVCGYGFGDKGINSEVVGWYYTKRGRRFVVIDPDRDKLVLNARGAIRNKWRDWETRDSVAFIEKPLEEVGRDEFMQLVCD